MSELLNSRQVAELFGWKSLKTVKRWRIAGRIPFVKYGTRIYRYPKDEVERIAAGGTELTERVLDIEAHVIAAKRRVERLRKVI